MTAEVEIRDVRHRFGTMTALDGVSLSIAAGEFVVLLGPSGCGKTTLLSILGGFISPTEGEVLIGGRDVTGLSPKDRPTTTMFQDYALFPHMSLRDNVAFGPRMRGMGRAERHRLAEERLALVGLGEMAGRRPHELSGGQRQRAALARALAVDPDVLLLDEPLGALDLKLRRQMQDELKAIQRRVGTTFIHVTHDQEEAMAMADRIVVMNGGRIEDVGPPRQVYLRPRSLFSAGFMGEVNRVPARILSAGESYRVETPLGTLELAADTATGPALKAGEAAVLCLRPEAFLGQGTGRLELGAATLSEVAFFGSHQRAHVRPDAAQDATLVVHLPQEAGAAVGDPLALSAASEGLALLPADR